MIRPFSILTLLIAFTALSTRPTSAAEDRRERVLNDRKEVENLGHWIYNDLPKAFADASKTGKPLLIVLRCIP